MGRHTLLWPSLTAPFSGIVNGIKYCVLDLVDQPRLLLAKKSLHNGCRVHVLSVDPRKCDMSTDLFPIKPQKLGVFGCDQVSALFLGSFEGSDQHAAGGSHIDLDVRRVKVATGHVVKHFLACPVEDPSEFCDYQSAQAAGECVQPNKDFLGLDINPDAYQQMGLSDADRASRPSLSCSGPPYPTTIPTTDRGAGLYVW